VWGVGGWGGPYELTSHPFQKRLVMGIQTDLCINLATRNILRTGERGRGGGGGPYELTSHPFQKKLVTGLCWPSLATLALVSQAARSLSKPASCAVLRGDPKPVIAIANLVHCVLTQYPCMVYGQAVNRRLASLDDHRFLSNGKQMLGDGNIACSFHVTRGDL
jgi:hypothetical protein